MNQTTHIDMIHRTVARQRAYFRTGATRPVSARVKALKKLQQEIRNREGILLDALKADLHKCHMEGYMCEVGMVLSELSWLIRHTPRLAAKKRVNGDYRTDRLAFAAKQWRNICAAGKFSSDRTVADYAGEIWKIR